ncbi:hypothetical protein BY458DRAFT_584005 [Sporodiniella umbellata]|nr:hypothetical protein BY458DRAFT_584005 [Sporodiniella umbellata]
MSTTPNNSTTELPKRSSIPDFSQLIDLDLTDSNVIDILNKEANATNVPESYKALFNKLAAHYSNLFAKIKRDEYTMSQVEASCEKYGQYVIAARENYDSLSELYQEQHARVLELEEQDIQKRVVFETEKRQQEKTLADLRQSLDRAENQKAELAKEFKQYQIETTRNAEKQGQGRWKLENVLMEKEKQLEDLNRAVHDLQAAFNQKTKEMNEVTAKYKALTTLLQSSARQSAMSL